MAKRKGLNANQLGNITNEKADTLLDEQSIDIKKIERFPPIEITPNINYKYVSHHLGFMPTVKVISDNGTEIKVGLHHIDENKLEISWRGQITGVIILN